MTLVAVVPDAASALKVKAVLRNLCHEHPARLVVVHADPDSVASLDAEAALFSIEGRAHRITFEEVSLTVGGQAALHLDSLVEAFTLSDLPVGIWYEGCLPDPGDPLLRLSTILLVDSAEVVEAEVFRNLLGLSRRRNLVDLCWLGLRPWREALAEAADPLPMRACVRQPQGLEVRGRPGEARLVAGWLVAATGIGPDALHLADSDSLEVVLTCADEAGRPGVLKAALAKGDLEVEAEARLDGELVRRVEVAVPDEPVLVALSEALSAVRPDRVWAKAVAALSAMAS